jgi:hypothetical protein
MGGEAADLSYLPSAEVQADNEWIHAFTLIGFMACTGQTLSQSFKKASIFEDKWLPSLFISGRFRGSF